MAKPTGKIAVISVNDSRNFPKDFFQDVLQENCEDLIWFDLKKAYLENGKSQTERIVTNFVNKEKPDYVFFFDNLYYDLDIVKVVLEIKKISNKIKTVFFSGDDDMRFELTRYIALFFDYVFITQNDYQDKYKKDGLKNTVFFMLTRPGEKIKTEKIYDVSFIGAPNEERVKMIEFLDKNGVNISVFGFPRWAEYDSVKHLYKGFISPEEYTKVIGQTKINLCLSKNMLGVPHLKGRFFEISKCRSFSLVEDSPQLEKLFKKNKEIVFFKNKEEMLKKIKHYLKKDKEREKIATAAYKKVNSKFNLSNQMRSFINKTVNLETKIPFSSHNYGVFEIDDSKISMSKERLEIESKEFDYVSFSAGEIKKHKFKKDIQVHSMKITGREVSCCDYFVNSFGLGDYAQFRYTPYGIQRKEEYLPFLNINQLVMTRKFFFENFDGVKEFYLSGKCGFVNNENTAFVSIPLVSINSSGFREDFFQNREFEKELGFFLYSFHRELFARRKNPLGLFSYSFFLALEILSGKKFIWNQLKTKIKNQRED